MGKSCALTPLLSGRLHSYIWLAAYDSPVALCQLRQELGQQMEVNWCISETVSRFLQHITDVVTV